jgi:hypothetical protein
MRPCKPPPQPGACQTAPHRKQPCRPTLALRNPRPPYPGRTDAAGAGRTAAGAVMLALVFVFSGIFSSSRICRVRTLQSVTCMCPSGELQSFALKASMRTPARAHHACLSTCMLRHAGHGSTRPPKLHGSGAARLRAGQRLLVQQRLRERVQLGLVAAQDAARALVRAVDQLLHLRAAPPGLSALTLSRRISCQCGRARRRTALSGWHTSADTYCCAHASQVNSSLVDKQATLHNKALACQGAYGDIR